MADRPDIVARGGRHRVEPGIVMVNGARDQPPPGAVPVLGDGPWCRTDGPHVVRGDRGDVVQRVLIKVMALVSLLDVHGGPGVAVPVLREQPLRTGMTAVPEVADRPDIIGRRAR